MASGVYSSAVNDINSGVIVLPRDGAGGDTPTVLKLMLVDNLATYDPDDILIADLEAGSELVCTNYTAGWGGSGRKTLTITATRSIANNRVEYAFDDVTWTALGGVANDTIGAAVVIAEGIADDTTTKLVAFFDLANQPTNGSDITVDFLDSGSGGNLRFTV